MTEDTMKTNDKTRHSEAVQIAGNPELTATEAAVECLKQYAKEHPDVVALWAFGIGFVLGWKLKPW